MPSVEPASAPAPERARARGLVRRREPRPVAIEHLDPGKEMVSEGHRLPTLEMRVAGHQRVGLGLGEGERDERERIDLLARLRTGVGDVEPERCRHLVVTRPTGVDLRAERAEQPLDRRVNVLVRFEDRRRVERDLREAALHLGELVRREEAGAVQPGSVIRGRLAVVRKKLGVLSAEELPHGGVERSPDAT